MSIKVIFACHQCGAAFEALQEHMDGQGKFACTDCGLTIHDWNGHYHFADWVAFTPSLLVRQDTSVIGIEGFAAPPLRLHS
jgi:DNA-directed RNA polymerase subunit RPC12/RpoP